MNAAIRARAMSRPLHEPDRAADQQRQRHRQRRSRLRPERGEDGRQRQQRADRQVDPAADDHERHADGDEPEERAGLEDVQEVVDAREPGRRRRATRGPSTTTSTTNAPARWRVAGDALAPGRARRCVVACAGVAGAGGPRPRVVGRHAEPRWRWMKTAPRMITAWTMRVAESGQVVGDERGGDELHQHRAGEGADDPDPAAGQRRPADHHRGDGAELDQVARRTMDPTALSAGRLDDAGEGGQDRAQDVHRRGASAGPERRPGRSPPGCRRSRRRSGRTSSATRGRRRRAATARAMRTTIGIPKIAPGADARERRVEDLGQPSLRDDQGDAPTRHEQASVATIGWMPK